MEYGHKEKNVGDAQVIVTSTAVHEDNPEVLYAKKHKIPVIPRIEMLAELARLKYTIAVAGTHGKTTTTSMVAAILQEGGLDPTFVVGGKIHQFQSGAKLGKGEFLVAEADESDGSFLKLSPTIGIVTNIDNDHLDHYKTMKALKSAFEKFANRVPFYGCVIACWEDANVREILPELKRRVITYGFSPEADYYAADIISNEKGNSFTLKHGEQTLGRIQLKLSGQHNVLNAVGACVCGLEIHIAFDKINASLAQFSSVARRLEIKAEKNGAVWVDDYGHHPTEIKATIAALKEKFPDKKLIVLFQPHRYTRTQLLLKDFINAFAQADQVFLLPIYSAGEKPIEGVSSKDLAELLKKSGIQSEYLNGTQTGTLQKQIKEDTIFLTLGAGDVWKTGEHLFTRPSTSG
jgi:UDP-N-acetylmuramate--alanine ligase